MPAKRKPAGTTGGGPPVRRPAPPIAVRRHRASPTSGCVTTSSAGNAASARSQCASMPAGRRAGMSAKVYLPSGKILVPALTMVLVPLEPAETTAFLRFNVQKSNDPRIIYEKGLAFLQSTYFQQPKLFDGDPTALFAPGSTVAEALVGAGEVVLEFEDYGQTFRMIARARRLKPRDKAFQATLWHNRTFNPEIANAAEVLSFAIEWQSAQAHPAPP